MYVISLYTFAGIKVFFRLQNGQGFFFFFGGGGGGGGGWLGCLVKERKTGKEEKEKVSFS